MSRESPPTRATANVLGWGIGRGGEGERRVEMQYYRTPTLPRLRTTLAERRKK